MQRTSEASNDSQAWDRLVAELPVAVREEAPAVLREALLAQGAQRELVPSELRRVGGPLVRAHLEREATRAVLRHRYVLGDEALAALAPADLDAHRDLEEIHPRLFAGSLLTRAWCDRLLAELARLRAWSAEHAIPPVAPNSMNRYGVMLVDLGLGDAMGRLTREALRPLAATRYPDLGGADLDDPHAFLVEYDAHGDRALDFHVDDSEVTLNLCLGEAFTGGDLYFRGLRCDEHLQSGCSPDDAFDYAHEPGRALLHAGRHRHGAHPITGGRRVNLIVWCRSPSLRSAPRPPGCPSWCVESRAR